MKSIKKDDQVKRVSDTIAESFVKSGWSYISKTEWKSLRPTKSVGKDGKNKEKK